MQTQLIATVAESYYMLLMLDEQIAVTTETVESWKEYIRSLKALRPCLNRLFTNPGAWLLQAVGSLVQPLFQRGQLMANLKISKAQQEEALLQFQQTLLDAGAEVNNALSQWQTARQKTVLDREQVEHLKDALRDTELLMEHGTTNYLEVLTARQSLLVARLSLVADRNAEIKSVITLYHALGGGNN